MILRACEWDECALRGVNPVLINDCMCCAEDTGSSVIHVCVSLAFALSLSLPYLSVYLAPPPPPLPPAYSVSGARNNESVWE